MNANELAEALEKYPDCYPNQWAANMLRQLQAENEALKKSHIELERGIVKDLNQRQRNEPVAWMGKDYDGIKTDLYFDVERKKLPYRLYESAIPLYTGFKELTDEDYKEALACLQFALDDTTDYLTLNNLGGENNHWLVWARAILRKAQEK